MSEIIVDSKDNKEASSDEGRKESLDADRRNLKNAAFCFCLRHALSDANDLLVEDGSLAAYIETGAHDLDAFTAVDLAAASVASRQLSSKYNRPLGIKKCLEFYYGTELEELVVSLDGKILTDEGGE